ncbi:MAG: trypsin-like peptidase domain-containing protein [Anaerolineae bacterium]
MSRQAALVTVIVLVVLLLLCNVVVAAVALPRVLAVVRGGNASSVAQQSSAPSALPTATPTPRSTSPRSGAPGSQGANPVPMPQITVVIPMPGGAAQSALPTATPGPSPTLGPSPTPFPPVAPLALNAEEQTFAALYNKVRPGVVNVDIVLNVPGGDATSGMPAPSGSGSGFVWDKQGHIVTNSHVVQDARTVKVTLWDDTSVPATVVGVDSDADLAVIKVDVPADKLIPLEMGDSDQVRVGQIAVALGNPFGVGTSMTQGIISAIGRTIPGLTQFQIPNALQTDAPINPGNSGGPLLDLAGRVLGVDAQIRSDTRANSGVGFAIPVNVVKLVVPDLIASGRHAWPWLGISGRTLDELTAENNNAKNAVGAYIDQVTPGGPSEKAGLKGSSGQQRVQDQPVPTGGDIVVAVNGVPIKKFDELLAYVTTRARVGQTIELTVLRNGQEQKVSVTLQERPRTQQQQTTPRTTP